MKLYVVYLIDYSDNNFETPVAGQVIMKFAENSQEAIKLASKTICSHGNYCKYIAQKIELNNIIGNNTIYMEIKF